MAKIAFVVPTPQIKLVVSRAEAELLLAIFNSVGGEPHGKRNWIDDMRCQLEALGVKASSVPRHGSIMIDD